MTDTKAARVLHCWKEPQPYPKRSRASLRQRSPEPELLAFLADRRVTAFILAVLLTGCGDLPQPFLGHPGTIAQRLSHPPPPRLDVPVPAASLLSDQAASVWSVMTAHALDDQTIPAAVSPARKPDWQLQLSATLRGSQVTPVYTLLNPGGEPQGAADGTPISAAVWASGDPNMLLAETTASAPRIIALMTSVDAAIRQSDPNSLVNRPARIWFTGVTGAPGDGNTALAQLLRLQLPNTGDIVQGTSRDADFTVLGEVHVTPDLHGSERVEVTWTITDSQNREAGRVAQLNDVPSGSLDTYWGDVALAVAQQAASGIHDVISNSSGRRKPPGKQGQGAIQLPEAGHSPDPILHDEPKSGLPL